MMRIASLGLAPDDVWCFAIARAAFAQGQVGMFDIANADPDVTTNIIGALNSGTCNVIAPDAGGIVCGFMGLALDAVADGMRGKFLIYGRRYGSIIKASGDVSRYNPLVVTTAKNLSTDHAAGDRIIAVADEAVTAPASATLGLVWFNGIEGLGTLVT